MKKAAILISFLLIIFLLVKLKPSVLSIQTGETRVILTGDVMLGRTVMTTSLDRRDPTYPFHKIADKLKSADLTFVNLENPIVDKCPRKTDGLIFCADPQMADGLVYAGVDIVSLANNHSANYGSDGIKNTREVLAQKKIAAVGTGNLVIKEINGLKFGFLGFEYIDKNPTPQEIQLIKDSNSKVDILIVAVHWGAEYQAKASTKQRTIAKTLVENGADVVVGHHPHWVQDIEYINSKPVYYSLGNFVFDQMWSQKTREGLAIKLTFDNRGNIKYEEKLPIFMRSWAQPEWVDN